jgi:hypothetical protein
MALTIRPPYEVTPEILAILEQIRDLNQPVDAGPQQPPSPQLASSEGSQCSHEEPDLSSAPDSDPNRVNLRDRILDMALEKSKHGRNDAFFWCATQLRDNRFTRAEVTDAGYAYASLVGDTDQHGQIAPYAEREMLATVEQAFKWPARGKWDKRPKHPKVIDIASAGAVPQRQDLPGGSDGGAGEGDADGNLGGNGGSGNGAAGSASSGGPPAYRKALIRTSNRLADELDDEVIRAVLDRNNYLLAQSQSPSEVIYRQAMALKNVIQGGAASPSLREVSAPGLQSAVSRAAAFYRHTYRAKEKQFNQVYGDPPMPMIHRIGAQLPICEQLPLLNGIIEVPTYRSDGSLITERGYDESTGLFYAPNPELAAKLKIDLHPTTAAKEGAVKTALLPLVDFPFTPSSRTNALALSITLLMRPYIHGLVPILGINSTRESCGKGLLVDLFCVIIFGRESGKLAMPRNNDDELHKILSAELRQLAPIIVFDNIDCVLRSDKLASAVTTPVYEARLLGSLDTISVPVRACWVLNGINLRLNRDLATRTFESRLVSKLEDPSSRTDFQIPDLLAWARANRADQLSALYILINHYMNNGRPGFKGPVMGRFPQWSREVGGVLHNAGLTDFLGNVASGLHEDKEESEFQWGEFVRVLFRKIDTSTTEGTFTTGDIRTLALRNDEVRDALPDGLFDLINKPTAFGSKLGRELKKRADRRYGNLWLTKTAKSTNDVIKWQIVEGDDISHVVSDATTSSTSSAPLAPSTPTTPPALPASPMQSQDDDAPLPMPPPRSSPDFRVGDYVSWHIRGVPQLPYAQPIKSFSADRKLAFFEGIPHGAEIQHLTVIPPRFAKLGSLVQWPGCLNFLEPRVIVGFSRENDFAFFEKDPATGVPVGTGVPVYQLRPVVMKPDEQQPAVPQAELHVVEPELGPEPELAPARGPELTSDPKPAPEDYTLLDDLASELARTDEEEYPD